jgi:hypothetical protein
MKRLLILLLAGALPALAAEIPASIRGTRALGMGDALTAVADDQNIFFYNPAGTVQRTGSLMTVADISATVSKDFIDLANFIGDNQDSLENFDKLTPAEKADLVNKITSEMVGLKPTFGASLPNVSYLSGPMFGGLHWGAGAFAQVSGVVGFNPVIISPSLYYNVNADAIFPLNLALKVKHLPLIPGALGLGANLKFIERGRVQEDSVDVFAMDNYSGPPAQMGHGMGMDFGALYSPTARWNIAATMLDFGGTSISFDALDAKQGFDAKSSFTESIHQRVNLGVAWTPGRLGLPFFGVPTHDRLVLAADVRDIVNADSKIIENGGLADTAGTHFHLGAEYRWWFLRFRAGANQGYFTGGLGVDWPMIKLDYAYYADELSLFAGGERHPAHRLSVSFSFGSGNTEGRERIKEATAPKAAPAAAAPSVATPSTPTEVPSEKPAAQ